jgi:agmatine deiminase
VDGNGLLLTTKECLLSKIQERNPGLGIKDYTTIFKKILGVRKIIWLEKGISGDDTHGHIDDVARFVSKNKVFLAVENNKKDKNFKNLKKNLDILNKTIIDKKKLKIIKIPMPSPKFIEGTRVPATYLNFYIANKIVLVPVFNDAKDKIVINIFKKNFKSRKIIPINCSELIWGFGAIHCMTQQEPI